MWQLSFTVQCGAWVELCSTSDCAHLVNQLFCHIAVHNKESFAVYIWLYLFVTRPFKAWEALDMWYCITRWLATNSRSKLSAVWIFNHFLLIYRIKTFHHLLLLEECQRSIASHQVNSILIILCLAHCLNVHTVKCHRTTLSHSCMIQ